MIDFSRPAESSLLRQASLAFFLIVVTTALVEFVLLDLSQLAALVLFFFAVISAAYYFALPVSLGVATLLYVLFNYLVVEPRYSLHVPDSRSWIVLLGFLLVSLRINTLVHKLKVKSQEAETAVVRHEFARRISECLLRQDNPEAAVAAVKTVLESLLKVSARICPPKEAAAPLDWDTSHPQVRMLAGKDGIHQWMVPVMKSGSLHCLLLIDHVEPDRNSQFQQSLQLACDQLNACVQGIELVGRVQDALMQGREEEMRNKLLASFSHDMRTPLTAILGAATSLNSQFSQLRPEEVQQLLLSIEAEAFHMATACENILSLVKLKSLVELPQPTPWQSPVELIEATVRRYELRRHGKTFQVESPEEPLLLRADALLLTQALGNLIDNACNMHQGPEPLQIQVSSRPMEGQEEIRISVLDRGPGFPPGFSFENLQRSPVASNISTKGFGLGLSITKAIMHLHRARLEVQDRPGGGSVVSMIFLSKPPSVDNHEF